MKQKFLQIIWLSLIVLAIAACGKSITPSETTKDSKLAEVTVSVKANDNVPAPARAVEAREILVTVLQVAVQSGDAAPVNVFTSEEGHQFNIASLKTDIAQLINVESIPVGNYDHVIITLADTIQVINGGKTTYVTLPESERKISIAIEIVVDGENQPTLELNVNIAQFHQLLDAISTAVGNEHRAKHGAPIFDVKVHDHKHPSKAPMLANIEGSIAAIADDRTSITLTSGNDDTTTTVSIGANTMIVIPSQVPAVGSVEQLEVGMHVDVRGVIDADSGAVNATIIRVETDNPSDRTEKTNRHGEVNSVDADAKTLVLTNTTGDRNGALETEITVDFASATLVGFVDADGKAVDFAAGQRLEVMGTIDDAGVLVASRIVLLHKSDVKNMNGKSDDQSDNDDDVSNPPIVTDIVKLKATLLTIDSDSAISVRVDQARPALSSAEITVNLTNATIVAFGMTSNLTAADLQAGDKLDIIGKLNSETNAVDATFVVVEHEIADDENTNPTSDAVVMKFGRISNIDTAAKTFDLTLPILMSNSTEPAIVKVDYSNANLVNFVDAEGAAIDIANDQTVVVAGNVNADGVFIANTIALKVLRNRVKQ